MVGWIWYSCIQDGWTGHVSGWQTNPAQGGSGLWVGSLLVLLQYIHVSPYYVIKHIYPGEWNIYIQVKGKWFSKRIAIINNFVSEILQLIMMNYAIWIILLNFFFFFLVPALLSFWKYFCWIWGLIIPVPNWC